MALVEFKGKGKPIEKLIETVSAGIGVLYKPTAIRKEADAEAYKIEKLAEAKAKGLILKADAEIEILERVKHRLVHQEVNRQLNLDNIVEKAQNYLSESVSEKPVDQDWRTKFFNKAQDISSEEMQEFWAKILANEVSTPGSVSLRTLDVLSNLNKTEAESFQHLAELSFQGGHILKATHNNAFEQFGITYDHLLTLRAANLVFDSDFLNITFGHKDHINGGILKFGEKFIKVYKDKTPKYTFNQVAITPAGVELIKTLNFQPNYSYLDYFIAENTKQGLEFEIIAEEKTDKPH